MDCSHHSFRLVGFLIRSLVYRSSLNLLSVFYIRKSIFKINPSTYRNHIPIDEVSEIFNHCLQTYHLTGSDPCQVAYKENSGTEDADLYLVNEVRTNLNERKSTIAKFLFLDYSSAFDTLKRQNIIDKLINSDASHWLLTIPSCTMSLSTYQQEKKNVSK